MIPVAHSPGRHRASAAHIPVFDAQIEGATNSTSLTMTHVVGSGLTKSLLLVAAATSSPTTASNIISTVTYNGVSLTMVPNSNAYSTTRGIILFYLLNPPAGSHSVVLTPNTTTAFAAISTSFQYVNQTTPFGTAVKTSSASTSSSSVTVVSSSATTDYDFAAISSASYSEDTIGSLVYLDDYNYASTVFIQTGSQPGTGGSDTLGWSWTTGATSAAMVGVAIHGG